MYCGTMRGKKMKKISFLVAPLLACILAFMIGSFADAAASNEFTLPLTISWGEEGLMEDETYLLSLEGMTSDSPMPKGSDKSYQVKVSKKASIDSFPTILYEKPGDYTYKLSLKREDGTQVGLYYLHISAYYAEGDKLTVTTAIRENKEDGAKTDVIRFKDPAKKKSVTNEKKSGSTSQTTDKKTPTSTESAVQTGDENTPELWCGAFLLGVTGLFFLLKQARRKSHRA